MIQQPRLAETDWRRRANMGPWGWCRTRRPYIPISRHRGSRSLVMTNPTDGIAAVAVDYLNVDSLFTAEELELREQVRLFVDAPIRANSNAWDEAVRSPREVARGWCHQGGRRMHVYGYGW